MENELFLETQTKQYGSHMVMTNVNKPTKKKMVNIDTEFRDEYNTNDTSYYNVTLPDRFKYNITLPDRITSAKSIFVKSIEIPMTFFNVSSNLGNNSFSVTNTATNAKTIITVLDGNYTTATIVTATNTLLSTAAITLTFSTNSNGNTILTAGNTNNYTIDFTSAGNTKTSNTNKYNFKNSFGWLMGFRKPTYAITANSLITSEYVTITKPSPRYLYLAIDEFNKSVQNSFVTSVANSFLNKNVIARISIDSYVYGNMLVANPYNGLLISDLRNYNGKIDLQKFNIQLLHENGTPVDLNGNDFSFCLEVTHE